ncbi:MAG: Ig-like domain-containing protein, partial [Planctomycetes bacterium]|nr:Ig-like domain-containing protein [Planctomycetota bacterium]
PAGLALGADNNLYVLGVGTRAILRYGAASQAAFTISLSSPSGVAVSVDFSTADISTSTGVDYVAQSGTVVFEPGMTTRTIIVQTLDDSDAETTESFVVNLSNASGATLIDWEALGQIIDDDSNSDPVAVADSSTADSEVEQIIDVLANDSDSDGDPLIVDSVGPTSDGGAVVINGDNTISYTSAPGFSGIESFDYTISDGRGGTATATVTVDVADTSSTVMFVADISFQSRKGGKEWRAIFEVRDELGATVTGANITITFAGQSYSGQTDGNGQFRSDWLRLSSGSYEAEVTDLAFLDYTWDLTQGVLDGNDPDLFPDALLQF